MTDGQMNGQMVKEGEKSRKVEVVCVFPRLDDKKIFITFSQGRSKTPPPYMDVCRRGTDVGGEYF